jgi:YgiT-type zinc finger domain-containing protein
MICPNCGEKLELVSTDLPFKVDIKTIVIIKDLPVLQCKNCNEYLIEDPVMARYKYFTIHGCQTVKNSTPFPILIFV